MVDVDRGDLRRVGHQEVHERGIEQLAVLVVGHALVQRAADPLRDTAEQLSGRPGSRDTRRTGASGELTGSTRAWQFGAGGLVAIAMPLLARAGGFRVSAPVAFVLGWAGLAGVVAAAFLVDAHTLYPGTAALLPTAGAALAIASSLRVSLLFALRK